MRSTMSPRGSGATILEATDGDQAIEVARREKPDLMTLDLSMPGKDGVQAFTIWLAIRWITLSCGRSERRTRRLNRFGR